MTFKKFGSSHANLIKVRQFQIRSGDVTQCQFRLAFPFIPAKELSYESGLPSVSGAKRQITFMSRFLGLHTKQWRQPIRIQQQGNLIAISREIRSCEKRSPIYRLAAVFSAAVM